MVTTDEAGTEVGTADVPVTAGAADAPVTVGTPDAPVIVDASDAPVTPDAPNQTSTDLMCLLKSRPTKCGFCKRTKIFSIFYCCYFLDGIIGGLSNQFLSYITKSAFSMTRNA